MKTWFLALAFAITSGLSGPVAHAESAKKKSTLNTQLYDSDESSSASGKVKVVREIQEETEVFLEAQKGSSGPFTLPSNVKDRARLLKILQASQKPGGSTVTLTLDDQQRIKDVQQNQSQSDSSPSLFGH